MTTTVTGWSLDRNRKAFSGRFNPITLVSDETQVKIFTNRATSRVEHVQVVHRGKEYSAILVQTHVVFLVCDETSTRRFGPQEWYDIMEDKDRNMIVDLMIITARSRNEPFPVWARPIWSEAVRFWR